MVGRGPRAAGADEWFRRARRNLRIARANFDGGFADAASFYAHQAAEFALKALQIHRTARFARTHDLTKLAKSVTAPPRIVKLAAFVTPAYVAARYPDVGGRVSRRSAEALVDASGRILRWVRRQLS